MIDTHVVTAGAAFGSPGPDITLAFRPDSITVVNEDGTAANYVEVSFDGTTVHAKLIPGVIAGLRFSQRVKGVWLRRGAGTPVVRVIAEAFRSDDLP